MRDALEQHLEERLRAIGSYVAHEVDAPADLDLRVRRRVRRQRRRARAAGLATVAVLVAGIVVVAVLTDRPPDSTVHVAASRRATADQIDPNVVMLDARSRFVVGLDAGGHQRETLVVADTGNVVDAQVTADHSTIWYLSVGGRAGIDCGKVVRADVTTGSSRIMFRAFAFAVSPDGARVALSGADCSAAARLTIVDLAHANSASTLPVSHAPKTLRWSGNGDHLASEVCTGSLCSVATFDAHSLAPVATFANASNPMFGADGLYFVEHRAGGLLTVMRTDAQLRAPSPLYSARAASLAVVPTTAATFVFGTVGKLPPTLFSVGPGENGHGVATAVQSFTYGTLVPVPASA